MNYQLTQTGEQVQDILNQAPTTEEILQAEITRSTNKDDALELAIGNEKTRAEGVEGELSTAIGNEKTRAEGVEANLQTAIGNEKSRAELIEGGLRTDVDGIEAKIPTGASSENKLATEGFVNSSVATNTADFKGTYNSLEALETAVQDANANDYAFVISTDSAGNTVYNRYKYVEGTGWVFEYALNNSSFTAAQWASINSAITAALVAKLTGLPTATELTTQLNAIIDSVATEKSRAEGIESGLRTDVNANATAIGTEKTRAEGVEGNLSTAIGNEKTRAEAAELLLQQNINAEALLRGNADTALQGEIDGINEKIPAAASSSNQLADKAFVNSSIATNTAEFKGTYNSLAELQAVTGANANDYGFVISTDSAGNTVYNRYKYVEGTGWVFEYALNNSSFTAAQWASIQSGITAALVAKLNGLPDIDALNAMFAAITSKIPANASSSNKLVDYAQLVAALAGKQDTLIFDNVPTENSNNPVKSSGVYTAIATVTAAVMGLQSSKQDVLTFDQYPTAGSNNPVKSKGIYEKLAEKQATLTFDDAPTVGSSNPVKSSGIKSAIDTVAGSVTTLAGRVSTNEADIAALQAAYAALTESDPVVVSPTDTWPVSNPQQNVIYRVVDRVNTPPQYYTDYMWNGTAMVEMAEYDNAIDDIPTPGSNNLVKSGGVFDSVMTNGSAFDISAHFALGGTLAAYADLNAALTALDTLSASYKKGGMSIKFVQSSDNKYVQFRYMSSSIAVEDFTKVANWQGVDDVPTAGSDNLVKSGGVTKYVNDNTLLRPLYEFSTNSYINRVVKELYLVGCNSNKKYYFHLLNYYSVTGYTANQIHIYQCDDDSYTNPVRVAYAEDLTLGNGLLELKESNSSGMSGYIIADIPQSLTSAVFTLKYQHHNFINTDIASKIDYSPCVKTFVGDTSLSDRISTVENVSHSGTSVAGTAYKEAFFPVKAGDKVLVTTSAAANYGVTLRISQDNGSTWVKSYEPIYSAVTNKEYEITHNGTLYVTIPSQNVTNVTTTIVCENLKYEIDHINAATLEYDNTTSKLLSNNVQGAIDEVASNQNCIGHNIYKLEDVEWAAGSAGQKIVPVNSTKRYRVRVTSQGSISYYVARYNASLTGTNYDLYTDSEWHEIPMLSDTVRIVLTATSAMTADSIEVETIGVEIYDDKFILPKHTYKVRKSGNRDFTSLLEACIEACKYPDSEVFVEEGTYDLIQEFESYYGSDFFTNYTSTSVVGIQLYNRVHLVFATNAVVTFNYEGNNEYVHTRFSPFNSYFNSGGGFTIENLHIRAKNCRYCIHDEKDSTNDSYHHAYINCDMYMDNSNNPDWSSKQCIGGGLGKDGYIEVIGCSFETVSNNIDETVFSWHNCGSSGTAKSRLNIRDNYVKKGTFTLLWIGATTAITKAYVSGNSFTAQPKHLSGGGSVENTELIAWNNEIRS